jgi:hypothetical protein
MNEKPVMTHISTIINSDLVGELENKNKQENIMLLEAEKENYLALREAICIAKKDFSFEDAINCWHKKRKFNFRTERKEILFRNGDDVIYKNIYKFSPL